jgi:hypothetical protein
MQTDMRDYFWASDMCRPVGDAVRQLISGKEKKVQFSRGFLTGTFETLNREVSGAS